MSAGGGYQQSDSQSDASAYGPIGSGPRRELIQRNLLMNLYGKDATAGTGGLIGSLEARTNAPVNYQTPQLTSSGLLPEQQGAFTEAVNQAMSRASGNFANRGFLRPENIQAIAGSAAQNVAPAFAPFIERNVAQRTQAPLIQEDMMRQRFADFINALGLGGTLLGGQSQSSAKSSSFGVQAQGGAAGGKP